MSKWGNQVHYHLTYKKGLQPISRQPEVFYAHGAAQEVVKEITARFREHGCRVKVYALGIHGCDDGQCDTAAWGREQWTKRDRWE
ncbi:MAG: hypothetical protein JO250_12145, partial [Armatimonadetes bacterium]|nr:hypothetical protein [Armatimonadota bacterium]